MALEGNDSTYNPRKLYERFKRQLKADEQDIFYDEDDLIEIYDQAADMEDEYVKLQTLLLAFRLYPKSEEMAARRGYFFWSYNMDDGVEQLLSGKLASDRLIWKILALRSRTLTKEELEASLESLIAETGEIDDETMIQLVDLASEAGAFDWLKSHEELLRTHTTFLPTLLYELQAVALIQGDRAYAIRKLEELTDLEPFNVDYWSILSEEQMNAGNIEAAISAADYALAIDATNQEAIIAKARAMACTESLVSDELLQMVLPLVKTDSSDSRALKIAATVLLQLDRTDEATEILTRHIEQFPWDRDIIEYLLALRYPKIDQVLTKFYESNTDNSETYWAEWATAKYAEGKFKEAVMIFGCYGSFQPLSEQNLDLYASALYIGGFYSAAITLLENELADRPFRPRPSVVMTGILSHIRLGNFARALELAGSIGRTLPGHRYRTFASAMQDDGLRATLVRLKEKLESTADYNSPDFRSFIQSIDTLSPLSDPQIDY